MSPATARPGDPSAAQPPLARAGALPAAHPRLRALARLAYVAVVLFATLPGTGDSLDPALVAGRLARAVHPAIGLSDVLDGIRNVLLFAGLGVVWIATTRTRPLWPPVARATLGGALLSLLVEAAQLTSAVRYASILDVATNATGALLGALAAAAVIRAARWELERGPADVPLLLVAASYLGATALEAFSPWGRPDRVPGVWGGPGRRLAASLAWAAQHPAAPPTLSDVLLFAPAGALAAAVLLARGAAPAGAAARATLAAAAAYAVAELARGVAGGDMRPAAFAARTIAAAAGALAVAVAATAGEARRGAARDRLAAPSRVAVGAAVVLACWYWRPFALRPGLAPFLTSDQLVPLRAFRTMFSLYSVADVAVDFLLFFPLGLWLAVRPLRATGPFRGVIPALLAAVAFELGQVWVAGRTFDVTDLLIGWAGVLVGWAVVRQARMRVLHARRRGPPDRDRAILVGGSAGAPRERIAHPPRFH